MGMHDEIETCLVTKDLMQACADYLRCLAGEWEWKRDSIPRNDQEMTELDLLISKCESKAIPSNVTDDLQEKEGTEQ